jgi:hypothetical protein
VGTDDGNLQLTTDGGKNWSNLIQERLGRCGKLSCFARRTIAHECKHRVRVVRSSHVRRLPAVHLQNHGWRKELDNISGNLPAKAYVQVVREDPKNTNLLYAGTELGLFASYNGGKDWMSVESEEPSERCGARHLVHPRENDLILATHGRSIWIFDDAT